MRKLLSFLFILTFSLSFGQEENSRIQDIKNKLDILSESTIELKENIKSEISVTNITLSNFLLAISEVHKVNINVAPELNNISIINNFSNVTVSDLLVFLSKKYDLTIDFSGNILSIEPYRPPTVEPVERIIPIVYIPDNNTISIDAKNDKLYTLFKRIIDESGKNLVFTPGLENRQLTFYTKNSDFDATMDKLALANNLYLEKTKDNFYLFDDNTAIATNGGPNQSSNQTSPRARRPNFFFEIKDLKNQILDVNFKNVPISTVINDIGEELNIDVFTATPLTEAGSVTFKAHQISFDDLLIKLFETQVVNNDTNQNSSNSTANNRNSPKQNTSTVFAFKKEGNIYFFGIENQLSVRKVEIIHLQHRSVELLADPSGGLSSRSAGRNYNTSYGGNNQFDSFNSNRNREPLNTSSNQNFTNYGNKAEALVNILPDEVKKDLDITVDYELNSFYVNGPSTNIERFKKFINKIDKPVPVILIEVMLIEVNNTSVVETGVSWGIGDEPVTTNGAIFPETNVTLGANTINKVIGGFDGFGSFNLGKVVPNFFATIKAMESNGNLKVRSTPKLSTLNGHRATFSNGQTSYYAVTQRNIYGTDNPQTSEITNYQPIDAELGLTIKPLVSGNGQVTLDIFVVQSSFGTRIAEDAPPDISSREFSSIIRVKDQDIVVLGGLEEQMTNNSGSGVPFLARVPVIKWLFSKRKREAKKAKLTVLIKPTIIN